MVVKLLVFHAGTSEQIREFACSFATDQGRNLISINELYNCGILNVTVYFWGF